MPRPDERDRVEPVRMLRLDRVLPVAELPVVTPLRVLEEAAAPGAGGPAGGAAPGALPPAAAGRLTGGDPQVEQ
jgi:hypothetical protein